MSIEAMKQALEALEEIHPGNMTPMAEEAWNNAITTLRAAIEAAEKQEPVAWIYPDDLERFETSETFAQVYSIQVVSPTHGETVPLYTTPPAAPVQEPKMYEDWYDSRSCGHCGMVNGHTPECRHNYKPPAAQRQWVGLTDEDREILEAVRREMDEDDDGNAPGHGHRIPGIWDEDNGDLAGKPCAWCLTWAKFTALIEREKNGGQA